MHFFVIILFTSLLAKPTKVLIGGLVRLTRVTLTRATQTRVTLTRATQTRVTETHVTLTLRLTH